jgi:beta-glucosidase/6-phospho-beta-glucosidase/beta-galactosidase
MKPELKLDFKKIFSKENFQFGVANAPYLCEGGYNYPHGIKNNFYYLERDGLIEKSKEAVRWWTDYEAQIKLDASLGCNAFRTGYEWARVQPSTSPDKHDPPAWDHQAVKITQK